MVSYRSIIDALLPKYCFGCGDLGVYICSTCRKDLKVIDRDICPYCRKSSYFGLTHPKCKRRGGLDGLKSLYYYNSLVRKIIKQIKYRLVASAMVDLVNSIPVNKLIELNNYLEIAEKPLLIAVPLSSNRLKGRGFNQAEILATIISKKIDLDINFTLIKKIIDTKPQVTFKSGKERYLNVRGVFRVEGQRRQINSKDLIIVDDVWTSGSTIKEIARRLKAGGAARIFALTLAR